MNDTSKKTTPVHKQSVVGEEDPGSAVDSPDNANDSAPPPAHPDRRVEERDDKHKSGGKTDTSSGN